MNELVDKARSQEERELIEYYLLVERLDHDDDFRMEYEKKLIEEERERKHQARLGYYKQWKNDHREEYNAYQREYRKRKKAEAEAEIEAERIRAEEDKREARREYLRQWRDQNRDRINAYHRQYYLDHYEEQYQYHKAYQDDYRAKRKEEQMEWKLFLSMLPKGMRRSRKK